MIKKIGVLTSGGDAPGMNAAVRAVVRTALSKGMEVYGIRRGYVGLITGDIFQMDERSVSDIIHRGGTMLYTARCERFKTPEGQDKGFMMAQNFGLNALVVIGGDGSMRGGIQLAKRGLPVMFIPGSIDNDLGYTDLTIGYDTSVNTVLDAIGKIRDTSESHNRTLIVEVMGRHCGDIAMAAGLAGGAESILVPEQDYDLNLICRRIVEGQNAGKRHYIIVKAEGVKENPYEMAKMLEERTGSETRVVVLGYIQRGGAPDSTDRILASRMGYKAIELIAAGSESRAIGFVGNQIVSYPLEEALNVEKSFDDEFLKIAEALA